MQIVELIDQHATGARTDGSKLIVSVPINLSGPYDKPGEKTYQCASRYIANKLRVRIERIIANPSYPHSDYHGN